MKNINENLNRLIIRAQGQRSQNEYALQCGINSTTITHYLKGTRNPTVKILKLLALKAHNGVTYEDFLLACGYIDDKDTIESIGGFDLLSQEKGLIPLVGDVIAGVPIEASENIEGYVYVGYKNPEDYFALKVHGDSMINAGITEKSILIVHKQNCADNGDIVVAAVDGKSTVKRYKESGGFIFLMPENPAYEPIPITEDKDLFIFGKVVQIRTDL